MLRQRVMVWLMLVVALVVLMLWMGVYLGVCLVLKLLRCSSEVLLLLVGHGEEWCLGASRQGRMGSVFVETIHLGRHRPYKGGRHVFVWLLLVLLLVGVQVLWLWLC